MRLESGTMSQHPPAHHFALPSRGRVAQLLRLFATLRDWADLALGPRHAAAPALLGAPREARTNRMLWPCLAIHAHCQRRAVSCLSTALLRWRGAVSSERSDRLRTLLGEVASMQRRVARLSSETPSAVSSDRPPDEF